MYCRKCGTLNDDNAYRCVHCGNELDHSSGAVQPQVNIPNYLVQSIIVTLLCCVPLGIPAILYSSQVKSKLQAGDIQGALDSSKKARMWIWISFGVGLVFTICYLILTILKLYHGGEF